MFPHECAGQKTRSDGVCITTWRRLIPKSSYVEATCFLTNVLDKRRDLMEFVSPRGADCNLPGVSGHSSVQQFEGKLNLARRSRRPADQPETRPQHGIGRQSEIHQVEDVEDLRAELL